MRVKGICQFYLLAMIFVFLLFDVYVYPQKIWEKLDGPDGSYITAIESKGDTILAATRYKQIYYSTNNGDTWQQSGTIFQSEINGLAFTNDGGILASAYGGIFKSMDLKTWTKISTAYSFRGIAAANDGNIYSGTSDGKILVSTDNGSRWHVGLQSPIGEIVNIVATENFVYFSGWNYIAYHPLSSPLNEWGFKYFEGNYFKMTVSSTGLMYVYSGNGRNFYVSFDEGSTWRRTSTGAVSGYYLSSSGNRVFVSGDEKLWYSDDFGATWTQNLLWYLSTTAPGRIREGKFYTYMGTQGSGILRSSDNGDTWELSSRGLTGAYIEKFTQDKKKNYYIDIWWGGIVKSSDKGRTWVKADSGLNSQGISDIITFGENNVMAADINEIFLSTNNGESWTKINSLGYTQVTRLYKDHLERIYLVTYNNGIFRTDNAGFTWTKIFDNGNFGGFAIDKSGQLYAGSTGGNLFFKKNDSSPWITIYSGGGISNVTITATDYIYIVDKDTGIVRSTDGGSNWEVMNQMVTGNSYATSVLCADKNNQLYSVINNNEILFSPDGGYEWTNISANLQVSRVSGIWLNHGGELLVGTDAGLWKKSSGTISSTTENQIISTFNLYQNYPNPFNSSTVIKYSIPDGIAGYVSLKIYDSLGREITELVNGYISPGEYENYFDAGKLSSGVYYYSLTAGQNTVTKKLLLIK
jgi:photosystem II stability/assembly factor-like uncharacterized protein